VSRWSVDEDAEYYDEPLQPNAECVDCGQPFSRAYDDQGMCCDGCSDRRDAHTSNLELRMAPATPAMVGLVDVAIVPADPHAPLWPVLEIALERAQPAPAVRLSVEAPSVPRRATIFDRLPTLSAVAASRFGKSFPKKQPRRKEVA